MTVYVILWSRTERGKRQLRGVDTSWRRAKAFARRSESYDGGWYHICKFKEVRK
jgi:hypothetical protein